MKKISLEQLVAGVILTFIDNIDSLGKPQNMPAEEWVKKMTDDDLFKLFDDISNLLIGHGEEKVKEEFCEICGYSNTFDSQEYHDNMPFGLCLKCMEKLVSLIIQPLKSVRFAPLPLEVSRTQRL